MADNQEHRGLWWLPGSRQRLPGTLAVTNGSAKLELESYSGHTELANPLTLQEWEFPAWPRILGVTATGSLITLENVQGVRYSTRIPAGTTVATYTPSATLIGKHFCEGEEVAFDEIAIRASDLNDWTRVSGFSKTMHFTKHDKTAHLVPSNIAVRFDAPQDIEIGLARGDRALVRFRGKSRGLHPATHRVELEQDVALHLRFAKRTGLYEVLARVKQVRNFLSLAVGRPVSILAVTGYQHDYAHGPSGTPIPIRLLWRIPYNTLPSSSPQHPSDILFTLADASPSISAVMRKWFAKQTRLEPVLDLFFGVRHHPDLTLEVKFLLYAQAVETYDYRRRPNARNDILVERMADVLSICRTASNRIVGSAPGEQQAFIEGFRDTRNYYTHYNPRLEAKAARGEKLLLLFLQLQAILETCLLRELGFGCRSIVDILARTRRFAEIDHWRDSASTG